MARSKAAPSSAKVPLCQVCSTQPSKYRCSACPTRYCSVVCYKTHKAELCTGAGPSKPSEPGPSPSGDADLVDTSSLYHNDEEVREVHPTSADDADPLREIEEGGDVSTPLSPLLKPLSSLNWPPEPDASIFTDPLKKEDPKPLRREELLRIATSSDLRTLLRTTTLPSILRILDTLPPSARHATLSRLLEIDNQSLSKPTSSSLLSGRNSPPPINDLLAAFASSSDGGKQRAEGGDGNGWWLRSGSGSKEERLWIGPEEKRVMRLFAGSVCVALDSEFEEHRTENEGGSWGNGNLEWEL